MFLKRLFDIIFSALAIIILSPVFVIIAILVIITDGLPIIYKQQRVGKNCKMFTMYKLRTMTNRIVEKDIADLGNVSVIKPNIITTGEFESIIIMGNKFKSLLWYQIRSKLFIEYIFNKKKYNNLYEYVNVIYFKKNKYKD